MNKCGQLQSGIHISCEYHTETIQNGGLMAIPRLYVIYNQGPYSPTILKSIL